MLAVTHADSSASFYLGGAAVLEYLTVPVFIYAGYWHSDIEGRAAAFFYLGTVAWGRGDSAPKCSPSAHAASRKSI